MSATLSDIKPASDGKKIPIGREVSDEKIDRVVRVRTGFNNIFKTRLEIDAKKIKAQIEQPDDAPGDYAFTSDETHVEVSVEEHAKVQALVTRNLKTGTIEISYWVNVSKSISKEFENDEILFRQIVTATKDRQADFINSYAECLVKWEVIAAEPPKNNEKGLVQKAADGFTIEATTIVDAYKKDCTKIVVDMVTAVIKAMGSHTRYKVRAGTRLTVSAVGVVVATVALGTAATPAAPATLIPAVAGLSAGLLSIGKQVSDLLMSVEACETAIRKNLDNWDMKYVDSDGKAKKKRFKVREFAGGVAGGLTGGASEWVFPTIAGTIEIVERHAKKIDGLVVKLHKLSVRLTKTKEEAKKMSDNIVSWIAEADKKRNNSKEWIKCNRCEHLTVARCACVTRDFLSAAAAIRMGVCIELVSRTLLLLRRRQEFRGLHRSVLAQ